MISSDYFRKSNALVIERLKNRQRQIDGKPLSECSDKPPVHLIAKTLEKRSDLYEWGGIKFSDEELAEYREMYLQMKRAGVSANCLVPDFIANEQGI